MKATITSMFYKLRQRISRWIDPDDTYLIMGLDDCIELGLPALRDQYGHSSDEVNGAEWMLAEMKKEYQRLPNRP